MIGGRSRLVGTAHEIEAPIMVLEIRPIRHLSFRFRRVLVPDGVDHAEDRKECLGVTQLLQDNVLQALSALFHLLT
ncbi:MAG TPA: hypothetical protein VGU45_05155, partial [Microvirga sp.]|nr:hypothetical protein [Microvirga sp.]